MNWIGVDYGSKTAGTTAVCSFKENQFHIQQSEKKKDADQFLKEIIQKSQPSQIFFDAPFSLPNGVLGKGDNYFYRKADKQVRAMSPMFIGGLTARAMKLKAEIQRELSTEFYESYPKMIAQEYNLQDIDYKQNKEQITPCLNQLQSHFEFNLPSELPNWHQFDSLLCWLVGWRFHNKKATVVGDKEEGLIYY